MCAFEISNHIDTAEYLKPRNDLPPSNSRITKVCPKCGGPMPSRDIGNCVACVCANITEARKIAAQWTGDRVAIEWPKGSEASGDPPANDIVVMVIEHLASPDGGGRWVRDEGNWDILVGELSHSCRDAFAGWHGSEIVTGLLHQLPSWGWKRK